MDKTSKIQSKIFFDWLSGMARVKETDDAQNRKLRAMFQRLNLRLVTKEDEMKKPYEGNCYQGKEMKKEDKPVKTIIKKIPPVVKRTDSRSRGR